MNSALYKYVLLLLLLLYNNIFIFSIAGKSDNQTTWCSLIIPLIVVHKSLKYPSYKSD